MHFYSLANLAQFTDVASTLCCRRYAIMPGVPPKIIFPSCSRNIFLSSRALSGKVCCEQAFLTNSCTAWLLAEWDGLIHEKEGRAELCVCCCASAFMSISKFMT